MIKNLTFFSKLNFTLIYIRNIFLLITDLYCSNLSVEYSLNIVNLSIKLEHRSTELCEISSFSLKICARYIPCKTWTGGYPGEKWAPLKAITYVSFVSTTHAQNHVKCALMLSHIMFDSLNFSFVFSLMFEMRKSYKGWHFK